MLEFHFTYDCYRLYSKVTRDIHIFFIFPAYSPISKLANYINRFCIMFLRSGLADAILFTGSLAAVAGTVMYLSERTRMAATAAAVLPTAIAALAALRGGTSGKGKATGEEVIDKGDKQLEELVAQMLADMKLFRQLIRKTLNLLQGMELMHSGYTLAVNTSTGAPVTVEEARLAKALADRACFPALRQAAYRATVDLIVSYRSAVEELMAVSPLAQHVDFKEHYIAFIDLKSFGIDEQEVEAKERVSVKELKDVVQVALIQQSEYLRRFALSFSESVREDKELNKAGMLQQVRETISKIKEINSKLGKVFEYHQAMGVVSEKNQRHLLSKRQTIDLIPLRSVYTSLFSTGLHLQNSLLKVRNLEKVFDAIEKKKTKGTDMVVALAPSDEHLLEWLRGFENVQTELNACVGCLDDGISQISLLQSKDAEKGEESPRDISDWTEPLVLRQERKSPSLHMSDDTPVTNVDEVFEAVIGNEAAGGDRTLGPDEDASVDRIKLRQMKRHSEMVLNELRSVLVGKAAEMEEREAFAMARQTNLENCDDISVAQKDGDQGNCAQKHEGERKGESVEAMRSNVRKSDPFLICHNLLNGYSRQFNGFEDSFVTPADSQINAKVNGQDTSSEDDDPDDPSTVKSVSSFTKSVPTHSSMSDLRKLAARGSRQEDDDDGTDVDVTYHDSSESEADADEDDDVISLGGGCRRVKVRSSSIAPSPRPLHDRVTSVKGEDGTLADLRSISSPDINLLANYEAASPYQSLESLRRGEKSRKVIYMGPSSSDDGSDDEDGSGRGPMLRMYERPPRPSAIRQGISSRRRDRNRTTGLKGDDESTVRNGVNSSSYVARKHSDTNPLFVPPKLSFQSGVAAQAAARAAAVNGAAQCGAEEVFGSSDSD